MKLSKLIEQYRPGVIATIGLIIRTGDREHVSTFIDPTPNIPADTLIARVKKAEKILPRVSPKQADETVMFVETVLHRANNARGRKSGNRSVTVSGPN